MRTIFISEMKTKIFFTVTFLAFLLANSSMAMSKFISSVNCCSIDSMARFLTARCSYQILILDQFSFRKTPLTGSYTNGNCEEKPSIIIFGTEFPWLYFWINCKSSRGPCFSTVNCTSATTYNCDATVTFFFIAQQRTTSDATTTYISFSALNQLAYLEPECSTVI